MRSIARAREPTARGLQRIALSRERIARHAKRPPRRTVEGKKQIPSLRSGQVVGASAELEAICSEIAEQVHLLDGVVQYRFGDDAELMGAWHSARNVAGPVKTKGGVKGKAR